MRRPVTLLLTLVLVLFPACNPSNPPTDFVSHRQAEILDPVVGIQLDGQWAGSGTSIAVVEEDGTWITYILTACHVIVDAVVQEPTGKQLEDGSAELSPLKKVTVLSFDSGEPIPFDAEVYAWDKEKDLALVRAQFADAHVALLRHTSDALVRFTECYASGMSGFKFPICNRGEVTGAIPANGWVTFNAHINFGYSGGGLYVFEDGEWRLSGVLVVVAMAGYYPLFHAGAAVDLSVVCGWFGEVGFDKYSQ